MSRNLNTYNSIRGHPLTNQRRLLLSLLRDTEGHIDAKELYRRASAQNRYISPATVYRTLNLFKKLGLIDESRLGSIRCYYEIKQKDEHQHLVCQGCGKVIEFQSRLVGELINTIQREHGFNVTRAVLHLEGYCSECKKDNT